MNKFVRIQSTCTIEVTAGLQLQDVTNPDAHIGDRLKINPLWPKLTMLIREGVGLYPVEILEWNTVKALADSKILTIGEQVDDASAQEQTAADALLVNLSEVADVAPESKESKKRKKVTELNDLVEE